MAKTLYLDCFAGASGDMLVGAMLDCGLDFELLRRELLKLGVEGYELSLRRARRSGISSAKFDVHLTGEPHSREHHHNHEHPHGEHSHGHHHPSHHRALSEIKRIISSSNLSDQVKQRAQTIFQRIGEAEAKIHAVPSEAFLSHEAGAFDFIVDSAGACVAFAALKIGRILSSPLHVGSGTFQCAHGTSPVPGPATAELLKGVPIYSKDVE